MEKSITFTESFIQKAIRKSYVQHSKYVVDNIFVFDWECDVFILKPNGYCIEFEIKTTKADFKNDAKKVNKHNKIKNVNEIECANKFYYVVPENLILKDDIPEYSGLIYVKENKDLIIVKPAPFIHKEKIDFEKRLCPKFYARWINSKYEAINLNYQLEKLKKDENTIL